MHEGRKSDAADDCQRYQQGRNRRTRKNGQNRQQHQQQRRDFFALRRDRHQARTQGQRGVALMVLQRVADLMCGHGHRRQRTPIEIARRQTHDLRNRVVMITLGCRLHPDMAHPESLQQVCGELSAATRIAIAGLTIAAHYLAHPQPGHVDQRGDCHYGENPDHPGSLVRAAVSMRFRAQPSQPVGNQLSGGGGESQVTS